MEAALVTGMFNLGTNSIKKAPQDVLKSKELGFEKVFSKKMDEKKGIEIKKENKKRDVNESKGFEEKKKVEKRETVDSLRENKKKTDEIENTDVEDTKDMDSFESIKDGEKEETERIAEIAQTLLGNIENIQEVENVEEITNTEEVEALGLSNEEMLKLKEVLQERMSQKVVEVGPQNVETEKITLNKYEDVENKLEALEDKLEAFSFGTENKKETKKISTDNLNENDEEKIMEVDTQEVKLNDLASSEKKRGFGNKDGKHKEGKFESRLVQKANEHATKHLDVYALKTNFNIKDVRLNNMSEIALNKTISMQEQIDVIKQISEKVDINLFEDKSEMIIKLKPDNLGKVTVEIAVENGNITAKFLAESRKVKEILEANMQDLKDHLAKQGMVVQDLSVSVGNDGRGQLFEQDNYTMFKRRQKIEKVDNESYFAEDSYGTVEDEIDSYWPDSTVSFSA